MEISKEKAKKTLRFKILGAVVMMVSVVAILFGSLASYLAYMSTQDCLKASMTSTAKVAAEAAGNKIERFASLAQVIANNAALYSETSTDEEKLDYAKSTSSANSELAGIDCYTVEGRRISDGTDASASEFFKEAKSGKTYISSPDTDETTGELVFYVSTPVWRDGKNGSPVVGVVNFLVKQESLNAIVENIKVSENGTAYITDKNGFTIANPDVSLVESKDNVIERAKTDSSLEKLASILTNALAGNSDFDTYTYKNVNKFVAYAPVSGTDGWSIFVGAPKADFMETVTYAIIASIILALLSILLGTIVTGKMTKGLAIPITSIMNRLSKFAEGDVSTPIPNITTTSLELDSLKKSMTLATENTGALIEDIDYLLTEISNGNLDIHSKVSERYVGDYENIRTSFRRLKQGLNESFGVILQISEQVSAGSAQVSSGAQTLAQGATEQASSIQELSASIAEVSQHVKQNAEDAEKAKVLSSEAAVIMQGSVSDMELASRAMNEISATSKNISKVIKAIDDIAFQTNILALNAAVEAARAGSAGKGFAVVADEVRNLSQKSAEAAKNTTALIESSIEAVAKGTGLVNKTSAGFAEAASKSAEVGKIVETIAVQAQEQAAAVSQISIGIEQVSSVVQMNSATSEESAAASEELSSQAAVLKNQVGRFKLAESLGGN
jgi:methyl-accepting chemotaxis protein